MFLYDEWNHKSYMGCIFVDFETIDKDTLLLKLALYGLGRTLLNISGNYITGCSQSTTVNSNLLG